MLHQDNGVPVGSLLPEGQIGSMMMGGPGPGPRSGFGMPPTSQPDNPWIAAAGPGGGPLMPINPPGPFGPGQSLGSNQGQGDLVWNINEFIS